MADVRPTRATRRVLLVLLTGASNLGGFTICRLVGHSSGTTHRVLARLEQAGWVKFLPTGSCDHGGLCDGSCGTGRRFYALTLRGRAHAEELLKLEYKGEPG